MNKTAQLIVNFEKENYRFGLIVMLIMLVMAIAGLFALPLMSTILLGLPFVIVFILKIFLYLIIGFFSVGILMGILYSPFFLEYKGPAAILDQKGIWIKHYNFIPWEEIKEFSLYYIVEAVPLIKIQVNNVSTLYKQSSWDGKLRISQTKLFGTPHITLGNLDIENEDIIIFAHRHLKR